MDIPEGFNLDILKVFGLEKSPEKWDEFFAGATEAIMLSVVRRVERELPEEKAEEFLRLFEGAATDEEKKTFLDAHVPRFKDIIVEEVARFQKAALKKGGDTAKADAN